MDYLTIITVHILKYQYVIILHFYSLEIAYRYNKIVLEYQGRLCMCAWLFLCQ